MCVSPPLRLSCLPVRVASYVVILGNEIRDECVGWSEISVFCMQVQFPPVCIPSTPGGLHAQVNSHNPHPVVTIIGLLSTPARVDNFLSTVYTIHT